MLFSYGLFPDALSFDVLGDDSILMSYVFNSLGLIGKYDNPQVAGTLIEQIADYLCERQVRVFLDETSAALKPHNGLEIVDRRTLARSCDLAIVLGGDGTLLNAARSLVDFQVAVLGINLGRLGFLTSVSPQDIPHCLEAILLGEFREEPRSLLHARVMRGEREVTQSVALNDVVVHNYGVARMIEVETLVDGQFLNAYRADGLIIATPTGSTAYALSSGGPIIHPVLETVVIVPICPHSLTHRPIVISADCDIDVIMSATNTTQAQVTCDGQVRFELQAGDRISIRKKKRKLRLIHPIKQDYFQLLRAKLCWGAYSDERRTLSSS